MIEHQPNLYPQCLYKQLLSDIADSPLEPWRQLLPKQIEIGLSNKRFGDLPAWLQALEQLPKCKVSHNDFKHQVAIGTRSEIDTQAFALTKQCLQQLIPWRKGPFTLFDEIFIDSEWRSDWKWQRIVPHIAPLTNRLVLDVGCGNGYYSLRMLGEGAKRVIGIDPSPRFVVQFYMLKHFLENCHADVLPTGIESLPANLQAFDTTFSMGVLYHRRSPMDHLRELAGTLRPGGELVLETLVIEGELGQVLVPEKRYAMMGNIWFIPSVPTLLSWLVKCGYKNARCIDVVPTSTDEQRPTEWMKFQSLENFLCKKNARFTVEGHPAPIRAILLANK